MLIDNWRQSTFAGVTNFTEVANFTELTDLIVVKILVKT